MNLLLPYEWLIADSSRIPIDAIAHFFNNYMNTDKYFKLRITNVAGTITLAIWIRPDYTTPVLQLVTGHEIIRCLTKDGVPIDIVFPHPQERHLVPAFLLFPLNYTPEEPSDAL